MAYSDLTGTSTSSFVDTVPISMKMTTQDIDYNSLPRLFPFTPKQRDEQVLLLTGHNLSWQLFSVL